MIKSIPRKAIHISQAIVAVFFIVISFTAVSIAAVDTSEQTDILTIANETAERYGYNLSKMRVLFDDDNSGWRAYRKSTGEIQRLKILGLKKKPFLF